MASPQPTDAHLRIAHSILEERMMRDFTKRQASILDLILRLSWGCGKKSAIIPRQKDFEIIGVSQTKIKSELEWLVNARVISWDKSTCEFAFNKNYDEWKVSIVAGYNRQLLTDLIHINLTSQIGKLLPEMGIDELPKKASENFPKKQVKQHANTDKESICAQSKESIKKSNIYTPEFEKFYAEYPRPEEKRRTFGNWKKCLKNYSAEQLMGALHNYKTLKAGTDKQFIKTSANFLGREKPFEDYIDGNCPKPQTSNKTDTEFTPEEIEFIERQRIAYG